MSGAVEEGVVRTRTWSIGLVVIMGVAAACSSSGSTAHVVVTTSTTTAPRLSGSTPTSTAVPTADRSKTPPLVAVSSVGYGTINAPVWYLATANAVPRSSDGLDQQQSPPTVVSENGHWAALVRAQDAVNRGGVTIIDVKSGKEVDRLDVDDARIAAVTWSPDAKAILVSGSDKLYLHRISGATASSAGGDSSYGNRPGVDLGFSTEGSTVTAATRAGLLVVDDVSGHFDPIAQASVIAQLDDGGTPVVLYADTNPSSLHRQAFRAVAGGASRSLSAEFPTSNLQSRACGRFLTWEQRDATSDRWMVYDATDGSEIDVGDASTTRRLDCPVVSPDAKQLAFAFDDGVYVVDLTSRKRTKVAREGAPISWSADAGSLLVDGNGTFVVRADGSGGKKANIGTARTGARSACRIGDTGSVLFVTETGLGLFDVGANSARSVATSTSVGLDQDCTTSSDGTWLLSGSLLVDVRHGTGSTLDYRATKGFPYSPRFRWYGDQLVTPAVALGG